MCSDLVSKFKEGHTICTLYSHLLYDASILDIYLNITITVKKSLYLYNMSVYRPYLNINHTFQVLENGKIVEFDSPFTLLQNPQGYLYQLTLQTGPAEHQRLLDMAQHAYISSRSVTGS
jgi:hypothetical protein